MADAASTGSDSDIDMLSRPGTAVSGPLRPVGAGERGRKLEIVEELVKIAADAGISLTRLGIAFAIAHPAVTAAIIGPRTMDQLKDLLGAPTSPWSTGSLDRIDQIVAARRHPSTTPTPGWQPPSLANPAQHRRPISERTAA